MIDDVRQGWPVHEAHAEVGGASYDMGFTRDPGLIAQYKRLRNDLYGVDRRFVGFRYFPGMDAENYEDPRRSDADPARRGSPRRQRHAGRPGEALHVGAARCRGLGPLRGRGVIGGRRFMLC
jgi:hypothetical protein